MVFGIIQRFHDRAYGLQLGMHLLALSFRGFFRHNTEIMWILPGVVSLICVLCSMHLQIAMYVNFELIEHWLELSGRGHPVSVTNHNCAKKPKNKVRTRRETFVPTTTRTTPSGCVKQPPLSKDGWYLSNGGLTQGKISSCMTPLRNPSLKEKGQRPGRHICAYKEVVWCMGEALESRVWSKALQWCGHLKERVDNCDATMSPKPHSWQFSSFFTSSDSST